MASSCTSSTPKDLDNDESTSLRSDDNNEDEDDMQEREREIHETAKLVKQPIEDATSMRELCKRRLKRQRPLRESMSYSDYTGHGQLPKHGDAFLGQITAWQNVLLYT
jgi:hypothetical protein